MTMDGRCLINPAGGQRDEKDQPKESSNALHPASAIS